MDLRAPQEDGTTHAVLNNRSRTTAERLGR
jgi:hypothetical protein